jgi:nucleoside permease NupC
MLRKLAFDTFTSAISLWKFLIGCSNTILKATLIHRPSNCVWLCRVISFQTSKRIKTDEKKKKCPKVRRIQYLDTKTSINKKLAAVIATSIIGIVAIVVIIATTTTTAITGISSPSINTSLLSKGTISYRHL